MQRFGEWVREQRKARNWTLETLSKKIGSHKGYVSGIENDKVSPPSAKICRKLAIAFQANPAQVMAHSRLEKMEPAAREHVMTAYELGLRILTACAATAQDPEKTVRGFEVQSGIVAPAAAVKVS